MGRTCTAAVAMLVVWGGTLHGQELRGRVSDASTGQAVPWARVTAHDARNAVVATTLGNAAGIFVLRVGTGTALRLRVESFGYVTETRPLGQDLPATSLLEIHLHPLPVMLDDIHASARQSIGARNLEGFLKRRETRKYGEFLGPVEIAAIDAKFSDHLLAHTRMLEERKFGGFGILPRGGTCEPNVFIDGRPMQPWRAAMQVHDVRPEPTSVDAWVRAHRIRGIEVYRSRREAPAEFQRQVEGNCPVVLVWTDTGFGMR